MDVEIVCSELRAAALEHLDHRIHGEALVGVQQEAPALRRSPPKLHEPTERVVVQRVDQPATPASGPCPTPRPSHPSARPRAAADSRRSPGRRRTPSGARRCSAPPRPRREPTRGARPTRGRPGPGRARAPWPDPSDRRGRVVALPDLELLVPDAVEPGVLPSRRLLRREQPERACPRARSPGRGRREGRRPPRRGSPSRRRAPRAGGRAAGGPGRRAPGASGPWPRPRSRADVAPHRWRACAAPRRSRPGVRRCSPPPASARGGPEGYMA